MKKIAIVAAVLAAVTQQPAWAKGACFTPSAIEAEQAIRFMTEVMVISSTCQNSIYAEFRLRNREPILAYQKAMIAHLHSTNAFDSWNTTLANKEALRQAGLPSAQVCQAAAELLNKAKSLDPKGFREYAAKQATLARAQYVQCGR